MKIGDGLFVDLGVPLVYCIIGIELIPSIVHHLPVERDGATCDVTGARGVDLELPGHLVEGFAVDG